MSFLSGSGEEKVSQEDIDRFYLREQKKHEKKLVLTKEQSLSVKQYEINGMVKGLVGVKRRFAVARRYTCLEDQDQWKGEARPGVLFLLEQYDTVSLVLMGFSDHQELWRIRLVNERGQTCPIEFLSEHFLAIQSFDERLFGISFAQYYTLRDFSDEMEVIMEQKKKHIESNPPKKKKEGGWLSGLFGKGSKSSTISGVPVSGFRDGGVPEAPPIRRRKIPRLKKKEMLLGPKLTFVLKEEGGMTDEEILAGLAEDSEELLMKALDLELKRWKREHPDQETYFDDDDDESDDDDGRKKNYSFKALKRTVPHKYGDLTDEMLGLFLPVGEGEGVNYPEAPDERLLGDEPEPSPAPRAPRLRPAIPSKEGRPTLIKKKILVQYRRMITQALGEKIEFKKKKVEEEVEGENGKEQLLEEEDGKEKKPATLEDFLAELKGELERRKGMKRDFGFLED